MTPAAITPAGRTAVKRTSKSQSGAKVTPPPARLVGSRGAPSGPGHPRRLRPSAAPKVPRRVSGPARGRADGIVLPRPAAAGAAAVSGATAIPAPLPRPARPRRTTQPRRPTRARPSSRQAGTLSLPGRALEFVRVLPDHSLLDRVVRGRTWIALLGVMLVGIVAMQVEVLKLGASIGRSLQRGSTLQSTNEALRANVAQLADDQRIERLAAGMGMVMPKPDGVGFLSIGPSTVDRAVANIHAPDAASFSSLLSANGAVATGAGTSADTTTGAGTSSASTATAATPSTTTTTTAATPSTPTAATPSTTTAATPSTTSSSSTAGTGASTGTSSSAAGSGSTAGGSGAALTATPTQTSSSSSSTGGAAVPAGG